MPQAIAAHPITNEARRPRNLGKIGNDEIHPVFKHKVEFILTDLGKLGWEPKIIFARPSAEYFTRTRGKSRLPAYLTFRAQKRVVST
jgi:hypothetical protein